MTRQPSPAALALQCAQWNERHPIGTPVTYQRDDGTLADGETITPAQVLSGHTAVIWIDGVSGCVALDRVSPRTLQDFDRAHAYAVGKMGAGGKIESVVRVVGLACEKLIARGYLSLEEARKLRDALTKAMGP
jgi:hypothetical protein